MGGLIMVKKKNKDYVPFSIKMEADVYHRFRSYADKLGQTYTVCLERMITEYLDEKGYKGPGNPE